MTGVQTCALPIYQLAVVVDDTEQGITDVVRGADLLDSTPRQILLQQRLGVPTPRHVHLPLLLDAAGRKLSKSDAARPVNGNDPMPTLHMLWALLGQAQLPACDTPQQFLAAALPAFRLERVPRVHAAHSAALHNDAATSDD